METLAAIALPLVIGAVGVQLIRMISGIRYCDQLRGDLPAADRVPLYRRIGGYDAAAVERHWSRVAGDEHAGTCEVRLLKMDLLFPFVYCGAFVVSVLILGALAERSVMLFVGLAMVVFAITFFSDLIESFVQLDQLQRYLVGGPRELSDRWIAIASAATRIKLYGLMAASLIVILMGVAVLLGL